MFAILIQHIKLLLLLFVSFLMSRFLTEKQRRALFPFVPAIFLTTIICSVFIPDSRLMGYILMAGMYACIAFLINMGDIRDIEKKRFFIWFLVFYAYYDLVNFYAHYAPIGFYAKNQGFIMYFLPGILAGVYCARNNMLHLVNRWVTVVAIVICLVYRVVAVQAVDIEVGERASMVGLNPNLLGLFMVTMLIFSLFSLVYVGEKLVFKMLAIPATLLSVYILIFTGSRNSFLGGVVALMAVIYISRRYRILNVLILLTVFCVGGFYFLHKYVVEDVRVLNTENYDNDSGRFQWWLDLLDQSTPQQNLIGRGTYYDESLAFEGSVIQSNMHSIYAQIYYEMGYVGCVLFLLYLIGHVLTALKNKEYGRYSLGYLAVALACGAGESYSLRGGTLSIVWGLSIGLLLVKTKIMKPEYPHLQERDHLRDMYPATQKNSHALCASEK